MVMQGMKFRRMSQGVLATVHDGVEFQIREEVAGYSVVSSAGAYYRADSLEDAVDFVSDCDGGD